MYTYECEFARIRRTENRSISSYNLFLIMTNTASVNGHATRKVNFGPGPAQLPVEVNSSLISFHSWTSCSGFRKSSS